MTLQHRSLCRGSGGGNGGINPMGTFFIRAIQFQFDRNLMVFSFDARFFSSTPVPDLFLDFS